MIQRTFEGEATSGATTDEREQIEYGELYFASLNYAIVKTRIMTLIASSEAVVVVVVVVVVYWFFLIYLLDVRKLGCIGTCT